MACGYIAWRLINPFTVRVVYTGPGAGTAVGGLERQGEPGEKNVPVSDCRAVNKLSESVICFN